VSRRGQSLVEGAFVLLIFCALLLGVVDCAQVLFAHQSLVERVRAAVRWGSLHAWENEDAIANLVLYNQAEAPASAEPGFLGLARENIVVRHQLATPERPDDELLTVAIVNFESHLFSPWIARALVSPRPVLVTAPIRAVPPPSAAGYPE
jgi:hypothetical protein